MEASKDPVTYKFEKNWYAAFVLPSILVPLWLLTTFFIVKDYSQPGSQLTFDSVLWIEIFFPVAISFIAYLPVIQLLTEYTPEGITRNYLVTKKTYKWEDLKKINVVRSGPLTQIIEFRSARNKKQLDVNTSYYKNPDELITDLTQRLKLAEAEFRAIKTKAKAKEKNVETP